MDIKFHLLRPPFSPGILPIKIYGRQGEPSLSPEAYGAKKISHADKAQAVLDLLQGKGKPLSVAAPSLQALDIALAAREKRGILEVFASHLGFLHQLYLQLPWKVTYFLYVSS
jgi:hypothetical protein